MFPFLIDSHVLDISKFSLFDLFYTCFGIFFLIVNKVIDLNILIGLQNYQKKYSNDSFFHEFIKKINYGLQDIFVSLEVDFQ